MQLVQQEHKNGCSIAALAMLTGKTYKQSLKKLLPKWKKGQLVRVSWERFFSVFGLKGFRPVIVKPINKINKTALIIIKPRKHTYHAVIWDPRTGQILDPSCPKPKPLSGRYQNKVVMILIKA